MEKQTICLNEEEFKNGIIDLINSLSEKESLELFENYCIAIARKADVVYAMDQLDEVLALYSPSEIVKCISQGNFDYKDNFFYFDAHKNLCSTNCIAVEAPEIASYIIDKLCALRNEKIKQYLQTTHRTIQFNGEELKLDRTCVCDWCEEKTLVGITHYGTTNSNRLICANCAKIIDRYNKANG